MRPNVSKAALLSFMVVALAAFAQTTVQMRGKDGTATPRDVLTDSAGRIVTSGSASGTSFTVPHCTSTTNAVTSVGTSSTNVPASADGGIPSAVATRLTILVCNSAENSGTPLVKCTSDGTVPVMGATNAGDVLEVSDCIVYATDAGVKCISDTAATGVASNSCF